MLSRGLVFTKLKCVLDAFFKYELTGSIRFPKSKFSVSFLGWKHAKSKHMGLAFKSLYKHLILKVVEWLMSIASVPYNSERVSFGSNTVTFSNLRHPLFFPTLSLYDLLKFFFILPIFIYLCFDFNIVRPIHFFIVRTISDNQINNCLALKVYLSSRKWLSKQVSNFKSIWSTHFHYYFNFNNARQGRI